MVKEFQSQKVNEEVWKQTENVGVFKNSKIFSNDNFNGEMFN